MEYADWYGCYKSGWPRGLLDGRAFAHPAKVPYGVAARIYEELFARGWLASSGVVVDPFGGIAGFAFHAMQRGCTWRGVELEPRFVELGRANLALWAQYGAHFSGWGSGSLLPGDSTRLRAVLGGQGGEAELVLSSPPYAETALSDNQRKLSGNDSVEVTAEKRKALRGTGNPDEAPYGTTPGQLGGMAVGDLEAVLASAGWADTVVSSPPYMGVTATQDPNFLTLGEQGKRVPSKSNDADYGSTRGNLANLPAGSVDSIVGSPPYAGEQSGGGLAKPGAQYVGGGGFGKNHGYQQGSSEAGNLAVLPEGSVDVVLSSPPYAESDVGYGDRPNRWEKVKDNPNFSNRSRWKENSIPSDYGSTEGQLGNLPEGSVSAVISSPPYAAARVTGQGDEGTSGLRNPDGTFVRGSAGWEARKELGARYGESAGNLANLAEGEVSAVVTSPPYEGIASPSAGGNMRMSSGPMGGDPKNWTVNQSREQLAADKERAIYGSSEGNIGNVTGQTFWSAAKLIVEECYALLKPGGYAVWMTGDYVRSKQRVPFSENWLKLCVACGFEPVLWARVWKREHYGAQGTIFGEPEEQVKNKVSFFRGLANKKNPEAAIWNEDVLFLRKGD